MNQSKIIDNVGLTFDDVLLLPNYTEIRREEIDVSTHLTTRIKLPIPLISSPMDTVTTSSMAIALGKLGGLGVIHRNLTIEHQVEQVTQTLKEVSLVGAAVGIGKDLEERVENLVQAGVRVIVIDSAHGYSKWVIEATKFITSKYKEIDLIAGSVGTTVASKTLIEAGASALRVGMGPGSICTTRIIAGVGIPQVTAILEAVKISQKYAVPIIADGGLRNSGDIVKALAAGADTVMSGSLFAGCFETPGELVEVKGKKYKKYRGMGSIASMKAGSAARYGQEYRIGQEKKLIAEGVEGLVNYKGKLADVVTQLVGGIKAGMYYTGVKNISELKEKTSMIRITPASTSESHPHDIIINANNSE